MTDRPNDIPGSSGEDLQTRIRNALSENRSRQQRELNRTLTISWAVIICILVVTYFIEMLKGLRTPGYLIAFWATMLIPLAVCFAHYRRKPDDSYYGAWVTCGYFVMYAFALITGSTPMVFTYILPILSFMVLLHRPRLILWTGAAALLVNAVYAYLRYRTGEINLTNSRELEIQIALIFLCFAGAWISSRMYDRITQSSEKAFEHALEQENTIHGLENVVLVDKLTGLGNRAAYDLAAADIDRKGERVGVIFCDVNGLKYCNDHMGHQAGDRLLQDAAQKLTDHFRTPDCFRISGDEFVVLIPRLDRSVFSARAKRFREDVQSADIPLVSVGWDCGPELSETIKNAEIRMYEDKKKFYVRFPKFGRS